MGCDNICLDEATADELLEELGDRLGEVRRNPKLHSKLLASIPVSELIRLLKESGVPEDLLDGLRIWSRQPLLTEERLKAWIAGEPIKAKPWPNPNPEVRKE